tara:strand:+ start:2644 stop:4785 length:2142 start_codon:yes stop_codon:yes gene_type:complete
METLTPADALAEGRGALTEAEGKALLAAYGIPVPSGRVLSCVRDARAACAGLMPPFALKIISTEAIHKSDIGGVVLGLNNFEDVRRAMVRTEAIAGRDAWLLEEMATGGSSHELVIGGVRHPRFGPMVMVGLGGVYVEVMRDVALRVCPIDREDAADMLASLRAAPVLTGARGGESVDTEALVDTLVSVGGVDGLLLQHQDSIAELDINPIIVSPRGCIAVDARVVLSCTPRPERYTPVDDLDALLAPRAVAVVGASTKGTAQANQFLRNLRDYGYAGDVFMIHPQADEIAGVPAYPSFRDLPCSVDYAYVAVAAERCAALFDGAAGKVRFAQVMSGGFGEGDSNRGLETALLHAARASDVRVLGPNCMGTHAPAARLTYMSGVDPRVGHVSVVAQSGGLSSDVLRRGAQRGITFRGLVTVGNSADVGPAELLPALLADEQTHVIGFYVEDVRRGRHWFEALRAARGTKPIVMLVGGLTAQGARAAASHTGALAADTLAFAGLARQCGVVLTTSLDEFLDVLLALQTLSPLPDRHTRNVVLLGNGGGTSVLAADAFGRVGLHVPALPEASQEALLALNLPQGTSVANPIDAPANALAREDGAVARRIVEGVFTHAAPDAFVIHMNVPVILGYSHADILGNLMEAVLAARADGILQAHVLMVLRSDGEAEIEAVKAGMRERALEADIPVYNELVDAARALAGFARYEKARRNND